MKYPEKLPPRYNVWDSTKKKYVKGNFSSPFKELQASLGHDIKYGIHFVEGTNGQVVKFWRNNNEEGFARYSRSDEISKRWTEITEEEAKKK